MNSFWPWKAQFVQRFHTLSSEAPRQNVGSHSFGVCILIHELWPDASRQLLLAALYHDVPEACLGDIPYTVKKEHKEIAQAFAEAEQKLIDKYKWLSAIQLSEKDQKRLKIADMLELVLFCHQHGHFCEEYKQIRDHGIEVLMSNFYNKCEDFSIVQEYLILNNQELFHLMFSKERF